MRNACVSMLLLLMLASVSHSQYVADTTLLLAKSDMQWWRDAKFGLFLHYGLYSILGRGEWVMWDEQIDTSEYSPLREKFTCEKLDARQWVAIAKDAGCRYMVLTARHHDGFCLFETKFGTYDAKHSAARRDIVAEYVDAAHKAGMRTGIYYSPLDWRYPGFFFPDFYRASAEELKRQTYTQVSELLTHYGKVDILWYDGGEDFWLGFGGLLWDGSKGWYQRGIDKPYTGKFSWEPVKLNTMVRTLQPKIVISQRSGWMGDFETQEMHYKGRPKNDRPYELCTRLGGRDWGWSPTSATEIMSLDSCIHLLVKVVTQDGNLLVNVGPRPDGSIEPAEVQRLKEIGSFLSKYGESIYATRGGIYEEAWGGTTTTDNAVYVHIVKVPTDKSIHLLPVSKKITSAHYLRDGHSVKFVQSETGVTLTDIADQAGEPDLIVKLTLR